MDLGLKGKVALVTGSGSRIGYGRGIALKLAEEGCDIISTDIDLEGATETAKEIESLGRGVLAIKTDVANRAEVDDAVRSSMEKFGKIDILINNAGTSSLLKPFVEMTREDWDIDIGVNLYGQMNVAQAVLPHMISRGYGRIINFTGGRGIPNISIYGAAKAGVIAFTEALAREVSPHGIIVNGIGPGLGKTGLVHNAPEEFLEENRQRSALKRLCTPDDVAPAVAFLASDLCSYMVGQFIHLSTF
jgi:NAD(P)-dependent dehydrogenase (short-subunit alcohol dehydrogenase family)